MPNIFESFFLWYSNEVGIFCRTTWCGDGKYFPKEGDILDQEIFRSQGVLNDGGKTRPWQAQLIWWIVEIEKIHPILLKTFINFRLDRRRLTVCGCLQSQLKANLAKIFTFTVDNLKSW